MQLFAKKKDDASTTTSASKSQFKVVHNKRNSLLSSTGHPSGWVNRTTEREDMADKGKDWRSDAFAIIPGSPSATMSASAPKV